MRNEPIADIIAELLLLPTEAKGRLTSICSGEHRGVLGVGSEHFSVRWFVPVGEELTPGGCSETFGIQFLFPEAALPYFKVGSKFTVWEGREIGSGRVLKVTRDA